METMMLALASRGLEVELLTTCEAGPLHAFLAQRGISVHAHPVSKRLSPLYYLRQIGHLIRFCRRRRIDVVWSHLQHASAIAVLAQFAIPARVVAFRHHFDFVDSGPEGFRPSRRERALDVLVNRLAREIVVPSRGVYDGMRRVERADMARVSILPYIYDFDRFDEPEPENVVAIRSRHPARLTLLMSARM